MHGRRCYSRRWRWHSYRRGKLMVTIKVYLGMCGICMLLEWLPNLYGDIDHVGDINALKTNDVGKQRSSKAINVEYCASSSMLLIWNQRSFKYLWMERFKTFWPCGRKSASIWDSPFCRMQSDASCIGASLVPQSTSSIFACSTMVTVYKRLVEFRHTSNVCQQADQTVPLSQPSQLLLIAFPLLMPDGHFDV